MSQLSTGYFFKLILYLLYNEQYTKQLHVLTTQNFYK